MPFMTLKELREKKKFPCKRIYKGKFHAENHEEFENFILEKLKEELGERFEIDMFEVTPNQVNYGTRFFLKSKIFPVKEGNITFRSKDYVFDYDGKTSYGSELKSENLTDYGFKIEMQNNESLEYHLIKE